MKEDRCSRHFLFGGAVSCTFPVRYKEEKVEVPDYSQVKYIDKELDESIDFEFEQLRHDVADAGAATSLFHWFVLEMEAQKVVIEQSATFEVWRMPGIMLTTCIGQMVLADQSLPVSEQQQSLTKVYVANLRLKQVSKDIVITAIEPAINSAVDEIGVPKAAKTGRIAMTQVFTLVLDTFIVNDWSFSVIEENRCSRHNLFGGAVSCEFPIRYKEDKVEPPDNQQIYIDKERDELIHFEFGQLSHDVADAEAATSFFQRLSSNINAQVVVIEKSATYEAKGMTGMMFTTCIGQMDLPNQSLPVSDQVRIPAKVYQANLRFKQFSKDILITAIEPAINVTASSVVDEIGVPKAAQTGHIALAQVFTLILDTFRVDDWSFFGVGEDS